MTVSSPKWMQLVFLGAGIYNILWGSWVVLFPNQLFFLTDIALPNHIWLWQAIGMMIAVIGMAYLLACHNPLRYFPLIFAGWIGRVLGPIGFAIALSKQEIIWQFGLTLLTNDIIWLPFFSVMMYRAWSIYYETRTNF